MTELAAIAKVFGLENVRNAAERVTTKRLVDIGRNVSFDFLVVLDPPT